ncbi:hypothetical protein MRX96_018697 [Rhipicephalus microplus]
MFVPESVPLKFRLVHKGRDSVSIQASSATGRPGDLARPLSEQVNRAVKVAGERTSPYLLPRETRGEGMGKRCGCQGSYCRIKQSNTKGPMALKSLQMSEKRVQAVDPAADCLPRDEHGCLPSNFSLCTWA